MQCGYRWRAGLFGLMLLALLAGCGNGSATTDAPSTEGDSAAAEGDPVAMGEELFNRTLQVAQAPTCVTCHAVEPGVESVVGPSLSGIAGVAGERVPGQSAEEYLREATINPDVHIVDGYQAGIMPSTYGTALTSEQIDSLVAYMLTLE